MTGKFKLRKISDKVKELNLTVEMFSDSFLLVWVLE